MKKQLYLVAHFSRSRKKKRKNHYADFGFIGQYPDNCSCEPLALLRKTVAVIAHGVVT